MHKKALFSILIAFIIIFTFVMTVFLIDKAKNNDKLKNNNIKNISLINRYTNHAWGHYDYAYLIDMEGTVLHFDYIKQQRESDFIYTDPNGFRDDLLKNIESEYYVSQYKTNAVSSEIKESLYSLKYGSIDLKYKNNAMDAGSNCYYCLIEYEDYSQLIKIKETGDVKSIAKSKKRKIDIICTYIDNVIDDIKN